MRQSNTQLYRKYIAQLATTYRDRSDIRMFIEMLLTSAAVFLFSVFAIRPTLITIGGLTTEISEKKQTISTMDTKIANLISAQDLFTQNSDKIALLDTAIPSEPTIGSYVKQIEVISSAHNVTIFTMSTGNIPIDVVAAGVGDAEQKIPFSVTFNGAYSNLLATLKDIENLRRPIGVLTSALSIDESNTGSSQLYLSVSGEIPYWPIVPVTPTP